MNTDEKLDRIIELLEGLNRLMQQPSAPHTLKVKRQHHALREAVTAWAQTAAPGRYDCTIISTTCGFPADKPTAHAIGRVLDELGFKRFRTGERRGFII